MTDPSGTWEKVLPLGEEKRWGRKKILYDFGDTADEIVLITEGMVKIVASDWNGNLRSIGILGPGSVLGEAAFFHDHMYKHMICCVEPGAGMVFSRRVVLEHILPAFPDILLYMMRNLAKKSYMMSTQLECVSFLSSEQIIALFLYHLGVEQEKNSWIYSKLAASSLITVGELLGMHRVTVTRIVNAFKREGIVNLAKGKIRIDDLAALVRVIYSTK